MHGGRLEPLLKTKVMNVSNLSVAVLECLLLGVAYVSLLYVGTGNRSRNDPATIKRRIVSVLMTCSISWVPAYFHSVDNKAGSTVWVTVGLPFNTKALASTALAVIHVVILFLLPLIYKLRINARSTAVALQTWTLEISTAANRKDHQRFSRALARPFADDTLWLWRNLVVAPFTEEFVFRACMAPLLLKTGLSDRTVVFTLPLFFGAAHLHHLRELTQHQGMRWVQACLVVLLQFTYTTVFGWYVTWLFIQSGSVWPSVVCHALCNWLQFPDFPGMVTAFGDTVVLAGLLLSVISFTLLWYPLANLLHLTRSGLK